jgi:hypothetical protein
MKSNVKMKIISKAGNNGVSIWQYGGNQLAKMAAKCSVMATAQRNEIMAGG